MGGWLGLGWTLLFPEFYSLIRAIVRLDGLFRGSISNRLEQIRQIFRLAEKSKKDGSCTCNGTLNVL